MKTLEIIIAWGIIASLLSFTKATAQEECLFDSKGLNAGSFVFLEAGNVTKSLGMALDSTLRDIVVKGGFVPLSLHSIYISGPAFIPMEEGYVVARPYPKRNYVAFDTFLWGKQESAQALVTAFSGAVGGTAKYSSTTVGDVVSTWDECPSSLSVQSFREDWSMDESSKRREIDQVGDVSQECSSLATMQYSFSNSKPDFLQTVFVIRGVAHETAIEVINERLRRSLEMIGIHSNVIRRWDTVNAKESGWLVHSILPSGNVVLYWDAKDMISINVFLKGHDHAWESTFAETFVDTSSWRLKTISHFRGESIEDEQ